MAVTWGTTPVTMRAVIHAEDATEDAVAQAAAHAAAVVKERNEITWPAR